MKINKQKIKKLPDGELEVMLIIWHADGPLSASTILHELDGRRSWALSSLMTVLSRLSFKGFVHCQKEGRHNLYSALVSEEEYRQEESSAFFDKLYHNSLTELVNSLDSSRSINEKDLQELRSFLDDMERGTKQ